MNTVIWILFESAGALAAVAGVVLFVLLVYWRRSGHGRLLLIAAIATVLLFVVQALVVTARERIGVIMTAVEQDIVRGRTDALAAALAPSFEAAGMDRDAFIAYVGWQMEKVDVRDVERRSLQITESAGDRVVITAGYLAGIVARDYSGDVPTRWALTFTRTADGWKIVSIEPLSVADMDNPNWGEIDRR